MAAQEYNYPDARTGEYLMPKERNTVLGGLGRDDQITHMARQRKISGDVIAPSVVVTTSKKLIIVKRAFAGLKSHISFVPYQDITGVRITHGILVSSVYVKTKIAGVKPEIEIKALESNDADIIFAKLNRVVNGIMSDEQEHLSQRYEIEETAGGSTMEVKEYVSKPVTKTVQQPVRRARAAFEFSMLQRALSQGVEHYSEMVSGYAGSRQQERKIRPDDMLIFSSRKKGGIVSGLSSMVDKHE